MQEVKWGEVTWDCKGSQFALLYNPSKMISAVLECGLDAFTLYCKLISFLHLIVVRI